MSIFSGAALLGKSQGFFAAVDFACGLRFFNQAQQTADFRPRANVQMVNEIVPIQQGWRRDCISMMIEVMGEQTLHCDHQLPPNICRTRPAVGRQVVGQTEQANV